MRFRSLSLAAALALSPTVSLAAGGGETAGAGQPKANAVPGFDVSNLDRSVKPCEDFNTFANGGWIAKTPIPPAYPIWGTFSVLADRNLEALRTILEAAANAHAEK